VGFNMNSNAAPPLGSQFVLTAVLYNAAPQFGKPTGARIGRVLVDCTFLAVTPPNGDGVCSGVAHVPDGYFTFGGSGGFSSTKYGYWAVTGWCRPLRQRPRSTQNRRRHRLDGSRDGRSRHTRLHWRRRRKRPTIRARAAEGLGFLRITIDPARNTDPELDAEIGPDHAPVRAFAIRAREDLQIAHDVRETLST
jgi:hypothetical protein